MAQVPYKPVPNVAPQAPPTPSIHLDTPGAAFGENVAQAQRGLGQAEEQAGNTLFGEALKLQQLQNESWAKDADVDVMIKIGKAQSEFDQLEGQNAVAALPAHMERIKAIREEAIASSPNPEARRFLDNSISRRVGFAIVDAGARAGQQVKVAQNRATEAQIQQSVKQADFTSPGGKQQTLETIKRGVEDLGRVHGDLPPTTANEVNKQQNAAFLVSLTKQAPNDPEGADKMLKDNDSWLDQNTRNAAQNIVNSNMARHQSRTDASDLLNGKEVAGVKVEPFDPQKGPGQLQKYLDAAKAVAEKKGKGNPDFPDALDGRVRANFAIGMAGYNDAQNGGRNSVQQYIQDNHIVDIDGVAGPNAPPEIRSQYNTLNASGKKGVDSLMKSIINRDTAYTPERERLFNQLTSIAIHEPKRFSGMDLGDSDVGPPAKRDQLLKMQRDIIKKSEDTSSFRRDLNSLTGMLKGAGLTKDSDEYNVFAGALYHEWTQFKETNKRSPDYQKDLYPMASKLLLEQNQSHWYNPATWFGGRKGYEVPDEHKTQIIKDFNADEGRDPSPSEIRMIYNLKLDAEQRRQPKNGP